MAWVFFGLFVVSLALTVFAFAIAVGWARVARRLDTEAQATRQALVDALTRAADEQTAKESALRLLDEQMRQRRADLEQLSAELAILREEYLRVQQLCRDALSIEAIRMSRRVN
jgi:uncharacterized membrane protein YhiD involved in acid resistance